jgi:Ni,Fe-hydrogenase III large subunit
MNKTKLICLLTLFDVSQALESLSGVPAGEKTGYLSVIFCELEGIAKHQGDIGAIMTDTGFTFGGSHGVRLQEIAASAIFFHEQPLVDPTGSIERNLS